MILYGLVLACSHALQHLPLHFSYALADRAADATFVLWRRGRLAMESNMSHVMGPAAPAATVRETARQALRNYVRYLVDFLRTPRLTTDEIIRRTSFNQWGPFEEALLAGKGAIFVGLHMGNWDFGGALLAFKGYTMNVVVDTFANHRLNGFVQGVRQQLGMKTIPRELAARRVLRALRRNEALAILMDRPASPGSGVEVSFFGMPAVVPAGAATLALRTGASLVPAGMVRLPDDSFLGLVDRCIACQPTGDDEEDVRTLTQQLMDCLAGWVRQYPDQWYMFRPMWAA